MFCDSENSNWSPVKSQLPPVEINWNLLYNQLVPVESHLVPVENAIQLVPVKTCPEIRENSNWSPVRSQLPPVTINWFPLKVKWFQLKMPFNWYQLKLVLRFGRILTGLLLEVYYHQLKSTGTCYNQLVPVESQLDPVESQLVPVENSNWSNRNFLLGFEIIAFVVFECL